MGRNISTYEIIQNPSLSDKLLGSKEGTDGTFNWTIEKILSLQGNSGEYTKSEMIDLISQSQLTPSTSYFITDATSTNNVKILVQASSTNSLFHPCLNVDDVTQLYTYVLNTDTLTPYVSGSGVPDGGTVGQLLTKLSSTDGDADWADLDLTLNVADDDSVCMFTRFGGFYHGTPTTPLNAASFTLDVNGAKSGAFCIIYHNGDEFPNFSEPIVNFTPEAFVGGQTNMITITLQGNQFVAYTVGGIDNSATIKVVTEATYTVLEEDLGSLIRFTYAGSVTVTLPQSLSDGFQCAFWNATGSSVTFQEDGTSTIESDGLTLETNFSGASCVHFGSNLIGLAGKLT